MKKIKTLFFALPFVLFSCSSSSNDDTQTQSNPQPQYAMTAKINGVTFEANNPFGTNLFSTTNIWSYFPLADYVMLQGRKGGVSGNPEINIWLKKSDIVVGTYTIGGETFSTPPSHFIDLTELTTQESEYTKNGSITITSVNTTTKIVTGTFTFNCVADPNVPNTPTTVTVTNGTFNYKYSN